MAARQSRPGTRVLVVGGIALLALGVAPTGAVAVDGDHDVVSDVQLSMACMPGDQIAPYLRFHLEAGADTPAGGRIASSSGTLAQPEDSVPYTFQVNRDWDVPYFPLADNASGDYEIDLNYSVARSMLEDDLVTVTLYYGDGTVAATDQIVVNCFNEGGDTQVKPVDITVRTGVPAMLRLREHMLLSGVDGAGDLPRQVWVVSPGLAWDADNRDADTRDDLVLQPSVASVLGATLADQVLTVNATTKGDYTLEWGVVTTPMDDEWTGGADGDRSAPAALRVHVIDGPVRPADSAITEATRGTVAAPSTVGAGSSADLNLGAGAAGGYVDVWLHSDPVYLGLMQVPANGVLPITVPASAAAGDHRVIVTDAIGTLIGWDDVRVTRPATATGGGTPGNRVPRGATGLDESPESGVSGPLLALLVAAGAAGVVGALVLRPERRRVR